MQILQITPKEKTKGQNYQEQTLNKSFKIKNSKAMEKMAEF